MSYSKQTWADGDPSKPLSAARMNHVEAGLDAVTNIATSLLPAEVGTAAVTNRINATRGLFRYATASAAVLTDTQAAADAASLSMLVIQTSNYAYAAKVKAANPAVKVGMYKNFGYMIDSKFTDGTTSTGIWYSDPRAATWRLKNGSTVLFNPSFTYLFAADVGNAAYATAWATDTIAEAKARGFDFIFADDVNGRLSSQLPSDLYPTDLLYQNAVQSGIAIIAPMVRAAGLSFLPNIGGWHDGSITNMPDHGDAIAAMCGGGMHEQYSSFGYPPTVQTWLNNIIQSTVNIQAAGGVHIGVGHGASTNTAIARLTIALDLIAMHGPAKIVSGMHGPDLATSYAGPIIDFPAERVDIAAMGPPLYPAEKFPGNTNVWRRVYTNGMALVNSSTTSQTLALGSAYSSTPAGITSQSSVTMAATTGLVLKKG